MPKPYATRETTTAAPPGESQKPDTVAFNVLVVSEPSYISDENELKTHHSSHQTARLTNSVMFKTLSSQLGHLTCAQQSDITA